MLKKITRFSQVSYRNRGCITGVTDFSPIKKDLLSKYTNRTTPIFWFVEKGMFLPLQLKLDQLKNTLDVCSLSSTSKIFRQGIGQKLLVFLRKFMTISENLIVEDRLGQCSRP